MILDLITPAQLTNLKPGAKLKDGGGLKLLVSPTGTSAFWSLRFTFEGVSDKRSLGTLATVDLLAARDLRHRCLQAIGRGLHPDSVLKNPEGAEPGTNKSSPKFIVVAQQVCEIAKQGYKNSKSGRDWQTAVDTHMAPLHDKRIHQLTEADIVATLEPIWQKTPGVARAVRGYIERILRFAKAYRPIGEVNLATLKEIKERLPAHKAKGSVRGKHAALNWRDAPALWMQLRAKNSVPAKAFQFVVLSGVRTNELLQMTFEQITEAKHEAGAQRWVIPGPVMKNDQQADIPLSPAMLQIIDEMRQLLEQRPDLQRYEMRKVYNEYGKVIGQRREQLVFPGRKGQTGESTLLSMIHRMGYDATTHGMRATFRSWGQTTKTHAYDTLEYCLHHLESEAHVLSYARDDIWDLRKACLLDWNAYVTGGVAPAEPTLSDCDLFVPDVEHKKITLQLAA